MVAFVLPMDKTHFMAKKSEDSLTDKQELFCKEYLIDLNGTQAAIRAGYSEKTAKEIASENLTKLNIQERIQELLKKRSDRTEITADMVLKEYAKIGFSDVSDFMNEGYGIKPLEDIKKNSKAVSSIEVTETTGDGWQTKNVKFKLHNKISALDSLAKHLGMFEKDNSQKQPMIAPQIIMGNASKPK